MKTSRARLLASLLAPFAFVLLCGFGSCGLFDDDDDNSNRPTECFCYKTTECRCFHFVFTVDHKRPESCETLCVNKELPLVLPSCEASGATFVGICSVDVPSAGYVSHSYHQTCDCGGLLTCQEKDMDPAHWADVMGKDCSDGGGAWTRF